MSRLLSVLTILTIFIAVGCGKMSKYGDVKTILNEMINTSNTYVLSLEKASNGKDVANAMNNYSSAMSIIKPKMVALRAKYPELRDHKTLPDKLKETNSKLQDIMRKLMQTSMKVMPKYVNDPAVQKAQKNLQKILH